jgi:CheY-like chemotaxis protein
LIVEDNRETLFIYEKYLKGSGFQVLPAANLRTARRMLTEFRPFAIILDVLLDRESGWDFLVELKESEKTRSIPVLVVTLVENEQKALSLGADGYCVKPVDRAWLLQQLACFDRDGENCQIVVIDDDEISRYLVRETLKSFRACVTEAVTGKAGIQRVRDVRPHAVILDFQLPDQTGLEVLQTLRASSETAKIPVVIHTSRVLSAEERAQLTAAGAARIISKERFSPGEEGSQLRAALEQLGFQS